MKLGFGVLSKTIEWSATFVPVIANLALALMDFVVFVAMKTENSFH